MISSVPNCSEPAVSTLVQLRVVKDGLKSPHRGPLEWVGPNEAQLLTEFVDLENETFISAKATRFVDRRRIDQIYVPTVNKRAKL